MNKIRKISIALFLCLSVVALAIQTGCSTMQGVGRDIEAAGDSIENTAERASR